jgi:hypothetical protein
MKAIERYHLTIALGPAVSCRAAAKPPLLL